jgi:hypothetical protein
VLIKVENERKLSKNGRKMSKNKPRNGNFSRKTIAQKIKQIGQEIVFFFFELFLKKKNSDFSRKIFNFSKIFI